MEFIEELRKMVEQHDKEIRSKAISEFYAAIENHYKIYKCVPSISIIEEIAEKMKNQ